MSMFRDVAQKTLSLSDLMAGRTKLTTDELIDQTVTITDFDFATITDKGEEKVFPILLFSEYPDMYYAGGALLSKLCQAWAAEFDGDVAAASNALHDDGGVQIHFSKGKTKSGNNLTNITVL